MLKPTLFIKSKLLNKDDIICEKPEFLNYIKNSLITISVKDKDSETAFFTKKEFETKEFFINQEYTLLLVTFPTENIKNTFKISLEKYFYQNEELNLVLEKRTNDESLFLDTEKYKEIKIEFQCSPTEITLLILITNKLLK